MKDEMPARMPYFMPSFGLPNTAVDMGTPRITVLIQVSDSQSTATLPTFFFLWPSFKLVNRTAASASTSARNRRIRKATMKAHMFVSA